MRTDEELRERFDRAATSLAIAPGDVSAVAARARQRARRQRAAGAAAGVAVALAAAVLVPRVVTPAERLTVDPVDAPTAPATPPPPPAATTDATATLAEDHLRYGIDGVHRRGREPRMLSSSKAQRALGLADGGAVIQSGTGGPLVRLDRDGTETELMPAAPGLRLLTVHDGQAWATAREPSDAGEDEEHLRSVPVGGGDVVDHGVSAGVESFTDALAFLPDGRAAWLGCHLQCAVILGDGHPATSGDRQRRTDRAGWYAGLAADPTGRRLALVDGPDPVIGGTSDVVVLDVDGRELARTPLPAALALDTAHVEFTADGDDLVAGDEAQAFVIRGWASDAPTVRRLEGDAGVALVPTAPVASGEAPTDDEHASYVARAFAEEQLGWTGVVVGEPGHDGRFTTVTVDGGDEARPATLLLEPSATGFELVVGGGHLAADHEDRSGWWFGIQAEDGRISVAGHLPAWAPGALAATALPPHDVGVTVGEAELDHDGTFEVALEVPAQASDEVILLITTRDGDRATSFALVRVPGGTFAAG